MTAIRFSQGDLDLFSEASGDRNPLHMSEAYAARTAYGQPVVFGVLGAIACLAGVRGRLGSIDAEFRRPLFRGVDYRIETTEREGKRVVRLFDGSAQVLAMTTVTAAGNPADLDTAVPAIAELATARIRAEAPPGTLTSSEYRSNREALARLARRWDTSVGLGALEILALSSYVVGMDLPGETALFFRLILNFEECAGTAPLRYAARVTAVNARLGYVKMSLAVEGYASGECHSFIRPAAMAAEPARPAEAQTLAGAVVAIMGASRGLGAAMKTAFEARGAEVDGLSRSGPEPGDASDADSLARFRERVVARHNRLDILVCNACPAIAPLRLEPNGRERIADYIARAVALTLVPMCALLDLVDASGGTLIVISSAAAERPVREWPHYTAAKQAIEALARTAHLQYPSLRVLIVRPEKLLTEMVGTPMGRLGAASPAAWAARIADRCAPRGLKSGVETLC